MTTETTKALAYVKQRLAEEEHFNHAGNIIDFDQRTVCPEGAQEDQGNVITALTEHAYRIRKENQFVQAAELLYEHRGDLDEWDRALAEGLHRIYLREKNITPEQKAEFTRVKNEAWISWGRAREADDFSLFRDSLEAVRAAEIKRVSLWEREPGERELSNYDRMVEENERGITAGRLSELFAECKGRITGLLHEIMENPRPIRTDFLYRRVTDEQQRKMADYLLDILGFDKERGTFATTEHPFTYRLGRDDVRITTHYEPGFFLSSIYSVIHETGHALFEQISPIEGFDHFLGDFLTMGQHESVSRFYENVIGRSESFIHLIYPKVCEIFPQVMADVTEQELYEAVNVVTPSLIRTEADELTYTLHVILRYEIEKKMIDGGLALEELPRLWNSMYQEYLGVTPDSDRQGVLQDMHWTEDFGYFPTYALGNFYGMMYFNRMKEDFDPWEAVAQGDFSQINEWMGEHVFARAYLLAPREWILDITGRELTAEDFLAYLEEKYSGIYRLKENRQGRFSRFDDYVRRMVRIRIMSSPQLYNLNTADAYSSVLQENFQYIGELASKNREVIDELIHPIIDSEDALSEEEIEAIHALNENLMDGTQLENIDLPVMAMLSERLKKDAQRKHDIAYLIRQLDEEIIASYALVIQTMRIVTAPEIHEEIVKKGEKALLQLVEYLDKECFAALDEESRELVMINSRYATTIYESLFPQPKEIRQRVLFMLEESVRMAEDSFYRELLPDYDWKYHVYRACQYAAQLATNGNRSGYDEQELKAIAGYGKRMEEMFLADPEYFDSVDTYSNVHSFVLCGRYHAGEITREEFLQELLKLYEMRDERRFDSFSNIDNISIPMEYIQALDISVITEEQRHRVIKMYRAIIAYAFHMQKTGNFYDTLAGCSTMILDFIEIPGSITFEEMGIQMMAAIHPPTYIHSNMVALISRCLASHLIRRKPELLVGVCGCPSEADVPEYAEQILDYTFHAALCHDFGKLLIIDTVFVYGRKLMDFEFNIIRQHPQLGAYMLEKHISTRDYADVARGHHRFYDNSRGYPADFDTSKSPVKTIIDIVTCADCMDAATDSVGRSYNRGKTFDEYVEEVRAEAGTRYAPYFPELLDAPEIRRDLEYLLSKGRQNVYRKTFHILKKVHENIEI